MATAVLPTTLAAVPARVRETGLIARWVWRLSGLNLALVVAALLLIFVVSERWWVSAAMTFLPRAPWGLPALVLGAVAACCHRRSLWPNVIALGLVAGPLMELRLPGVMNVPGSGTAPQLDQTLRIVSCNVQGYRPRFAEVLNEVEAAKPDVVLFQEAFGDHPLLHDVFPGWHRLHVLTYWIASKYPIQLVAECPSEAFDRVSGIVVELDTPHGAVLVANIHQMTARPGLLEITPRTVLSGEASGLVDGFRELREFEAVEIRATIDRHRDGRPLIVTGDFNTPTCSHVFQQSWGDLQSAFDVAGTGYGYTSPCRPHRYWFENMAWARIDHILCSSEWKVEDCRIGRSSGSDHHLIAATLRR